MAKKRAKRGRRSRSTVPTADYTDAEGGVLTLRAELSPGTIEKLREPVGNAAASVEDQWRRRTEMLFERLAVSWTIAGMPITDQKTLLGRYRLASADEQAWVRTTIDEHIAAHVPELG